MLGWEFPPFISGGLGTACYGLTKGLGELGVEVYFILPRPVPGDFTTHVNLITPSNLIQAGVRAIAPAEPGQPWDAFLEQPEKQFIATSGGSLPEWAVESSVGLDPSLSPYSRPAEFRSETTKVSIDDSGSGGSSQGRAAAGLSQESVSSGTQDTAPQTVAANVSPAGADYSGDLFGQVDRYARMAAWLGRRTDFDVVHAHDWITYRAGIAASRVSGKPLVVHVHSTEFDRSGENVNQAIYDIEREGVHCANRVITVSHLTKTIVVQKYGVSPEKIRVIYNAIDVSGQGDHDDSPPAPKIQKDEKIVLFLGRITMQKGPEYFVRAAKRVLEIMSNVRFIMAGSGDLARAAIELAAELGIGHKVLFTGFLRGRDVERVFRMADLFVMPSVSEPFGLVPLEAMSYNTPVLISKQSGVAELLTHALKVDFWDVDEMANKIVAVLRHPPLQTTLSDHGSFEVRKMSWKRSAENCVELYDEMTR